MKTDLNPIKLTAQKMKFSMKDFFSKCDQIRRKLRIWSHLLKKSLMENFLFCAVTHRKFRLLLAFKRTVMQIEKALINDHLRV